MTIPEQRAYLSQMRWMPIVKIQKDIHFIMNMIAQYMTYDHESKTSSWKWDPDYDEGETAETRDAEEMWRIRQDALDHGLPMPDGWAKKINKR